MDSLKIDNYRDLLMDDLSLEQYFNEYFNDQYDYYDSDESDETYRDLMSLEKVQAIKVSHYNHDWIDPNLHFHSILRHYLLVSVLILIIVLGVIMNGIALVKIMRSKRKRILTTFEMTLMHLFSINLFVSIKKFMLVKCTIYESVSTSEVFLSHQCFFHPTH